MMIVLREVVFLVLILLYISSFGQLVKVIPERPDPDDLVTIIFDASQGNQALMNHQGDVYIHIGLVTGTIEAPSGWTYVQGEWGKDDPKVKMRYLGNHRYRIQFRIREFFGLPPSQNFLQMSFVFRDQSGAKIGAQADDSDIYYPDLNTLAHGPLQEASGKDGQNLQQMVSVSKREDGTLVIRDATQVLMVKPYGDEMVKLDYFPKGHIFQNQEEGRFLDPEQSGEVHEEGNDFEIILKDGFRFHIFTNPIRMELYHNEMLVMSDERGCFFDQSNALIGDLVGFRTMLKPDEAIYETGFSSEKINRRGKRLYHNPKEKETSQHYPFILSNAGYGIYIDSYQEGYADLGKTQPGIMEIGLRDSALSWFIIPGKKPEQILKKAFQLMEKPAMPFLEDMSYQQVSHEDVYQFWKEQEPPEEDDEERDAWPEISLHLRKMLAAGMGGSPYQFSYPGSMGTGKETDQLIREAQYRVFNPVMKGLNPNLDNTGALGKNIQLRQKFLPYNYTLAWENSQKGFPLARPMYMHYSEDVQTRNIDRQFLWGESVLVAPIFNPDPEEKKVYFPAGKWFDFFTSRIYVGGGWRNVQVASGHLPVFVKEGSFLPLLPDTVSNFDGRQFEIRYFPDYQGDITSEKMYLDNGKEPQAFKNGNYLLVELKGMVDKKGILVKLNTSGFGFPEIPDRHQINLAVMDLKSAPKKIFINGKKIQMLSSGEFDVNTKVPEAYGVYIPGRNRLDIFWIWDQLPGEIVIKGKFK